MPLIDKGMATPEKAGRRIGVSGRQVRSLIERGDLRAVRTPSGRYWVKIDDLAKLFDVVNEGGAQ